MGVEGSAWEQGARRFAPDPVFRAFDYVTARRRVERAGGQRSLFPWRGRFVQAVVTQAVAVMDTPEGFRPVTALLVTHPPAPEPGTRVRQRLRWAPDAADLADAGLMLNVRKRVYRLLAEVAEGQGHQPPESLAIVFRPRDGGDEPRGPKAFLDRWWGFGLLAEACPEADLAALGARDVVERHVRSAIGGTRPLRVDELRPIRRVSESDLGLVVGREIDELKDRSESLADDEFKLTDARDEVRHQTIPSPGDDERLERIEVHLTGVRRNRALVAEEITARSTYALEIEAWGEGAMRVRGLGVRLVKVRKTRHARAWAATCARFGARVRVDADTEFRLGRDTWTTQPGTV